MARSFHWAWLLCLLLTAGCIDGAQVASDATTPDGPKAVVIALIDSGVNPYLPVFRSVGHPALHGAEEVNITLTSDVAADRASDKELWPSLEPQTLYHFAGTRVMGISFDASRSTPSILDAENHGGATAYLAAREAGEAYILSVQVSGFSDSPLSIDTSVAEAMEWIADQPWIDIVSISMGIHGNPPATASIDPVTARYLAASERASMAGKLILNAAGNTFIPATTAYSAGPPWVIAVGGAEEISRGEGLDASRVVDLVSNYSDYLPDSPDGAMDYRGGTSFATPIVAGTVAAALARVRAVEPERVVSSHEVREALNASAIIWNTTDWDPTPPDRNNTLRDLILWTSLPIVTQAQMGWGYVNASLAPEIARRILEQDFTIPPGKEQAEAFQPRYQAAREEYWARFPPP